MRLSEHDLFLFFLTIAVLIAGARLAGELCKKWGVPGVIGELAAGICLGPTVFGALFPEHFATLFRSSDAVYLALSALVSWCSVFLLFVVGLEINVRALRSEGRPIAWLGSLGIVIPFAVGCWVGHLFQYTAPAHVPPLAFAVLIGAAFAVSALPVIARVLMDMQLLKSRIGTIVIGSAAVNDVCGWLLFVFALSLAIAEGEARVPLWVTIAGTLALTAGSVTVLPALLRRCLVACEKFFGNGVGTSALVLLPLLFFVAALTEYLGVHALFGAFIVGITVGGVDELSHPLRESIETLTLFFFAPLFFVSVGLKANFLEGLDAVVILGILIAAFLSKILSSMIGGRLGGLSYRESLAAGFGLAARGGMGIIIANIAYNAEVISLPVFTALIIMAVVTSITAVFIPQILNADRPHSG